ncbi:hypothetical protein [Lactococcus lactis]|uniref:hypothetical protein n=1 Tax=Lactococcus lactis TaxID=1358 RepID=UPI0023A92725|nr:hypothetical protein [Lactococcus lactis]WEA54660.1 hypothetical protein PWP91_10300 [Lactococcus lactis]
MEKLKNLWDDNDWLKAIVVIILYLGFAFYLGQFWVLLSIAVSFIWLIISRKKENSKRLLPAAIILLGIITLFMPSPFHNTAKSKTLKDIPSGLVKIPDIVSNDKETAQAYLDKAGIKVNFISVTSYDSGIAPDKVSFDKNQPGVKTFDGSEYELKDKDAWDESYIKKGDTLIVKVADKIQSSAPSTSSSVAPNSSVSKSSNGELVGTSGNRASDDSEIKTLLYLQSKTVIQQKQNITGIKINNSSNNFVFVDNDGSGKSWLVTGQFNWQGETHYFTINFMFNKNILDKSVNLVNNADLTYDVQQATIQ